MYILTDEQIEYILNDIRRRGVEMEDLQMNLLDHICCIIEQNLKPGEDFEGYYRKTVQQFYKKELREIEDETFKLLTFKNYYMMKKMMLGSGFVAAIAFILGSIFKAAHWPGVNILMVIAIVSTGLIFMPLVILLKTRETDNSRDKIVLGLGMAVGILFCIATLLTIMHWPGAAVFRYITIGASTFLLIPTYFFTGIRKPETKVNTLVTTVLLIAVTGLLFIMMRTRQPQQTHADTYVKSEQLLRNMQSGQDTQDSVAIAINATCEKIKSLILQQDIGAAILPADAPQHAIAERGIGNYEQYPQMSALLKELKQQTIEYNQHHTMQTLPVDHVILNMASDDLRLYTNLFVLNNVVQLQMFLANAEARTVAAS